MIMSAGVVEKFAKATDGLGLNRDEKRMLIAWYKDDFEDIERIPQETFNIILHNFVKTHLRPWDGLNQVMDE